MLAVIIFFLIYLVIDIIIYLKISKINASYFNSYTLDLVLTVLIRLLPFMFSLHFYSNDSLKQIYVLIVILYLSTVSRYIGYLLGRKIKVKQFRINGQIEANKRYGNYLFISNIISISSFLILAFSGVGIKEWIFNSRYAYMTGRNGNGIWYILFELFIIVSLILSLCIAKNTTNKKKYLLVAFPLIESYFTGSKGFFIGICVLIIFFIDRFEKRIELKKVIGLGIVGLLFVCILLSVQSNLSLLEYSDYYSNFMKFIKYVQDGNWNFTHGKIQLEDFFWKLLPRSLFPNKPTIYGEVRIIELFYSKAIIEMGNTPSFSEFVMPYADFGIIGVFVSYFMKGVINGFLERELNKSMNIFGCNFNAIFIFALFFICEPVNFNIVYVIIGALIFIAIQKINIRFVIIKREK